MCGHGCEYCVMGKVTRFGQPESGMAAGVVTDRNGRQPALPGVRAEYRALFWLILIPATRSGVASGKRQ